MKVKIDIPNNKLLQILVPEHVEKCEVFYYNGGNWLMECDTDELNHWRMQLPDGKYEVIGRIKDVVADDDFSEIETDKNFILMKL